MDAGRRSAYLRDFEAQIKAVDAYISAKAGHDPSLIFIYEERPDKADGYHIEDLASYYPKFRVDFSDRLDRPKKVGRPPLHFSTYLIYAPAVARFIERTLERTSLSGYGDQAIGEFWIMLAVALARFRVVAQKEVFRGVKLRTKESMVKHRLLFTESNNEIEGLRNIENQDARLTLKHRRDIYNVDTFWTLQLFSRVFESGHTFEEALEYITLS